MSRLNLEGLSVGDTVRVVQTIEITDKREPGDGETVGWVRAEDVKSREFHYYGGHERFDTLQIEMVKKAAKPKPKVGDVISTRAELTDLPALAVVLNRNARPFIVTRDGTITSSQCDGAESFVAHARRGDESLSTAPYTVVYLP